MEAAEQRRLETTPYIQRERFNQKGFNLTNDDAWKMCVRLNMLIQSWQKEGYKAKEIKSMLDRFLESTFDYFLMKKDKKNLKSINAMWDRTRSMRAFNITTEASLEEWKKEKKEWDKMEKELETTLSSTSW